MQTSARQNYPAGIPQEIHPEQDRALPHMRPAHRPLGALMVGI